MSWLIQKKHCVYNAKINFKKKVNSALKSNINSKTMNKIVAHLKNIVSKIFKFNWVINSDTFSHITD